MSKSELVTLTPGKPAESSCFTSLKPKRHQTLHWTELLGSASLFLWSSSGMSYRSLYSLLICYFSRNTLRKGWRQHQRVYIICRKIAEMAINKCNGKNWKRYLTIRHQVWDNLFIAIEGKLPFSLENEGWHI